MPSFPTLARALARALARTLAPLVLLLASAPVLHAQATPTQACVSGTPGRLGTRLPDAVLDRISGMSASPFAHAFILAHLAENGRQDHWLVKCIQDFRRTPATDLPALAALRIDMGTLLKELRAENAAAREEARLRSATGNTLAAALAAALPELSVDEAGALGPILDTVRANHCTASNRPVNICAPLDSLRDSTRALLTLVQRASAAASQVASIDARGAAVSKQVEENAAAIAADSSLLLQARIKDSATAALRAVDTVLIKQNIEARVAARTRALDTLGVLKRDADRLATEVRSFQDQQRQKLQGVAAAVRALRTELTRSGAREIATTVAVLAPADASDIVAELPQPREVTGAASVPRAAAPSVALALADFVIDRAKQELVFAFIARIHDRMRRDALLQAAFPETYRLMASLASLHDSTLSVPTAASIPVTVWRSTASADFLSLADHIVAADPGIVCPSSPRCRERVTHLRPFAAASTRLLTGDPILDVIRDLPDAMGTEWTAASRSVAMTGVLRGAHVVSGLAEAYYAQGAADGADPARHPYILTPRAFSHAGKAHRDFLIRLLLARSAVVAGPAAARLNEEELAAALLAVTRVIDQMQARAEREGETNVRVLVQQAFRAMGESATIGRLLVADSAQAVATIHDRWKAFGSVVEPVLSRDYGLVLSRSALLYRQLTDAAPPPMMMTFASLGASLAEAQDAAQMRAAFEAAAAPVGGWQAKRYRQGSRATITALPGLVGGREKLIGGEWSTAAGAALPIGLDIQLNRRLSAGDTPRPCRLVCSTGLFIPVVDLGALASYRFDSDSLVESEPRANFRQVIAPGAYLSFGLGRSPIVLFAGGQLMPSLRTVDPSLADAADGHAFRWGLGVGVDVVLLNVSGR